MHEIKPSVKPAAENHSLFLLLYPSEPQRLSHTLTAPWLTHLLSTLLCSNDFVKTGLQIHETYSSSKIQGVNPDCLSKARMADGMMKSSSFFFLSENIWNHNLWIVLLADVFVFEGVEPRFTSAAHLGSSRVHTDTLEETFAGRRSILSLGLWMIRMNLQPSW